MMKARHILIFTTLLASVMGLFAQNKSGVKANVTSSSRQQITFVLKGKIRGQDSGFLKLSYTGVNGKFVQDSAAIQNGSFEFRGKLNEPVMAYFTGAVKSRAMDDPNTGSFFLEPGNLMMEVAAGDFKNLKLKGSKTQDEVTALSIRKKPHTDQLSVLSAAYNKANTKNRYFS